MRKIVLASNNKHKVKEMELIKQSNKLLKIEAQVTHLTKFQ